MERVIVKEVNKDKRRRPINIRQAQLAKRSAKKQEDKLNMAQELIQPLRSMPFPGDSVYKD